jgi:hypothetical protein
MSDMEVSDGLITRTQLASCTVLHLAAGAAEEASLPVVKNRILAMLPQSGRGMIIDCRHLPPTAASRVAPLLYALLVAGRACTPRVTLCVVGAHEQTIGRGSAFLLPARFETVEAAAAALGAEHAGRAPAHLGRSGVSAEPIVFQSNQTRFLDTGVGQLVLITLVLGLVGSAVAYSARASFQRPVPRRRFDNVERSLARTALQGNVRSRQGKSQTEVPDALVIVWPSKRHDAKFKVVERDLFGTFPPPDFSPLVVAFADKSGRYAVDARTLPQSAAPFCLLAISSQSGRSGPPLEDDLKSLAEFFEDPENLLGTHPYQFAEMVLDVNVTKDKDFLLSNSPTQETKAVSTTSPATSVHESAGNAREARD